MKNMYCEKCDYSTTEKYRFDRHCNSLKHKGLIPKCQHVFTIGEKKGQICNKICRGENVKYCKVHNESRKKSELKRKESIAQYKKELLI